MSDYPKADLIIGPWTQPATCTMLEVRADGQTHLVKAFRVAHYDLKAPDADGYSEISTRNLPRDVTAWELAQIIDLTIRAPNYVVRRDFAAVAHLFKPVAGEDV